MIEGEYEEPATCEKAEAIRRKFCLENYQVYEDYRNDYTFDETIHRYLGCTRYLCFEESELVSITHNGKKFYIYKT